MLVKTCELGESALNWVVAKLEGHHPYVIIYSEDTPKTVWINAHTPANFCTDWAQGGPIIEEKNIWITGPWRHRTDWKAASGLAPDDEYVSSEQLGSTPLIAAMRCHVARELGEEVDIPKELL